MYPYIGITDFMNFEQVQNMLAIFTAHRPKHINRELHVGVMMSYKTLHGIPSKWQKAFPRKEDIYKIFSSTQTYNCLHYADYDDHPNTWKSIAEAIEWGSRSFDAGFLDALQLDMVWPSPRQIKRGLHYTNYTKSRRMDVILQIGKNALEEADNDPRVVVQRLKEYEGIISRVLLDKSMGKGLGMDAQGLIPFARAIRESFPTLEIGAAGGLGPETMHLVEPLIKEFPDISIDAQGRLRPSGNALDPVDWNMAGDYLVKALQLFSEER